MPRITAATAPASVTGRPATWAGAAGPVWSTTSGCCPSGSGPSTFAGARRGADPAQVAAVRSGLPLYIAVGEADPGQRRAGPAHPADRAVPGGGTDRRDGPGRAARDPERDQPGRGHRRADHLAGPGRGQRREARLAGTESDSYHSSTARRAPVTTAMSHRGGPDHGDVTLPWLTGCVVQR